MTNLREIVRNMWQRWQGKPSTAVSAPDEAEALFVTQLMQILTATQDEELACDAVFDIMDLYAEALLRGEDVSQSMPLVEHHLMMCGACREELELLLALMRFERGDVSLSA